MIITVRGQESIRRYAVLLILRLLARSNEDEDDDE
jgi:hypothetical protein